MDGESADEWLDGLAVVEGRETWDTYHFIGDVLRNPELAIKPSPSFRTRLAAALEQEMAIVAAPRRAALRPAWRYGLSGFAAAAAVAAVAWIAQPYVQGGAPAPETRVIADAGNASGTAGNIAVEDSNLRDYLEAHRQLAGPTAVRQVSFDAGAGR
jgi:sigma-E factor negative regulatory protein RseA